MRDYTELVKALRTCKMSIPCTECSFYSNGDEPSKECATMNVAAADAIEELVARNQEQEYVIRLLHIEKETLKGKWEDTKRNGIKRVLDTCCGSKMMWFDRNNPDVEFCDIREVDNELIWTSKDGNDKRYLTVAPDTICDVRHLPFEDNSFYHIVFDPPHLQKIGDTAWLCKKYGKLDENWESFIHDAFVELMRVLKPNGTLIFKWSEIDITVKQLLSVIPYKPLYGHRSGKHTTTHWMAFIKADCPNCGAKMEVQDA